MPEERQKMQKKGQNDLSRGVRRFFEVLTGNLFKLIGLNLFFMVCAAPAAALFLLGLSGTLPVYAYALSVAAAYPVGGAVTAGMFCISKMIYGEPGFLWFDFRRKLAGNIRQAAAPGMVCTAFIFGQIFYWGAFAFERASIDITWLILGALSLMLFALLSPLVFLQIAYIDLKTLQIFRNSAMLAIANLPRCLMGAVAGNIIWIAFALYLPVSMLALPVVLPLGFSLSWLLCLMWVWPPFNRQFSVEETINKRRRS